MITEQLVIAECFILFLSIAVMYFKFKPADPSDEAQLLAIQEKLKPEDPPFAKS